MDHQQLRRLDLNLLHSLDALLRELNVTRSAAALGVSQPVMSAALGRLRRHFDDELLVRRNHRYEPTPLARQLQPAVTDALRAVDRVVSVRTNFDASQHIQVTLVCGEIVAAMLLPGLQHLMTAEAPQSTMRIIEPNFTSQIDIDKALAQGADGIFLPHGWVVGLESIDVLEDRWVFAVSSDDSADSLTLTDLQSRPWLVADVGDGDFPRGMQQVLAAGVSPRVEVAVSGSMSMPYFLRGTDRVAVMGRRLIESMGDLFGIREVPGPFELEPLRTAFWWHANRREDPVHSWLRGLITSLADPLEGGAEADTTTERESS